MIESLKTRFELLLNHKVDLKIKDNASVFLHVKKQRNLMTIFLHKAFLKAPISILSSLDQFLLSQNRSHLKILKNFMYEYFQQYPKDVQDLVSSGITYDLKMVLEKNNEKYFNNQIVDLKISWFNKPNYRTFSSITFGSYHKKYKLITINRILDNSLVPEYFLSFIIYHEMLHHIIPISLDEKGRRMVHSKRFKDEEKKHEHYLASKSFKKQFLKKRNIYGWS